jgi:hypothetical protein
MNRLSRLAAPALMMFSLAGSALAMPAIADRLPTDVSLAVIIPNIEDLEKDIRSIASLVGLPADAVNVDQVLSMAGIEGAVSKKGPLALFVGLPKEGVDDEGTLLFPVANFDTLVKGLGGELKDGIATANVQGNDVFIKQIDGGMAIMGANADIIKAFKGEPGQNAAHAKAIGPVGVRLADTSDLIAIINVAPMRAQLKEGFASGLDMALSQAPLPEAPDTAQVKFLADSFIDQTRAMVFGLRMDQMGVSLDMVTAFEEGSPMAAIAAKPGRAHDLTGKLPSDRFVASFALDLANPELLKFLRAMPKPADENQASMIGRTLDTYSKMTGVSFLAARNPAGITAGVLARGVVYHETKDSSALADDYKATIEQLKTDKVADGFYDREKGPAEVNGKKADAWSMRLLPNPDAPEMAQAMVYIYGLSGGPNGYSVRGENFLVQTYAKSTEQLNAAVKAANGENGLNTDTMVKQVAEQLSPGRTAEIFISTKTVIDSVLPLAGAFLGGVQVDLPEQLPPVALGISTDAGAARSTVYVPNAVIKAFADIAKAVQAAQGGGEEEPPADEPANKKGGGEKKRPGF